MDYFNHPERLTFEFDMINHKRSQTKFKGVQSPGGMDEIKQGSRHTSLATTGTREKILKARLNSIQGVDEGMFDDVNVKKLTVDDVI